MIFAKLAGLQKLLARRLENPRSRFFDPTDVSEYYELYIGLRDALVENLPELFADLPRRDPPIASETSDNDGRGYVERKYLKSLYRDIEYIFEVRAHSELASPESAERPQRVFISHGGSDLWRKVQAFLERDVGLPTLELAQQPNLGRTVLQKLEQESDNCCYAVVVMTSDDEVSAGPPRARQNVMHEIGYFQAKFGLQNVCLLHEEGTSIPSNIHGLVYIPFPEKTVEATFGPLAREIRVALKL